jgi:DNA-binding NtrC family response regulator
VAAGSPEEALEILRQRPCQLVIQDMNFTRRTSGEEGLALLHDIRKAMPTIPVILITAWGSIGLAVEGMKAGASDFVTKPWTNQQMVQAVQTALGLVRARTQAAESSLTRDELDARYDFGDLVGRDPRMLRILELIGRVARAERARSWSPRRSIATAGAPENLSSR